MLTVATGIWDANEKSHSFSRCYDERWVERLAAGFRRNLTRPYRFVLFTDRPRAVATGIEQEQLRRLPADYGSYIEPYRLGEPMILVGLDTVVIGNVDHLADYCLAGGVLALPRDPFAPQRACTGAVLCPAGRQDIAERWPGGGDDMDWMRQQPHVDMDALFPGQVVSYKGRVRDFGFGDARIVYFHGHPKPHEMVAEPWIRRHWLGEGAAR